MKPSFSDQPFSTGQVAAMCRVDARTVLRWIKRGQIKAFQLPGRGDHRIERSELIAFLQAHSMPIPVDLGAPVQRVLIVDDDENMARAIQRGLRGLDIETKLAFNGFHAGTLIERWRPQLITLDLSMPGIGGTQVLGMLRADTSYQHTRVLLVSGQSWERLEEAILIGADGMLRKPFENEQLVAAVSKLLDLRAQAG